MASIEQKVGELGKVGRYEMWAESFHCDFKHELQMGHLGNYMLNAADFHSTDRGFGMRYLNTINKTWVLSRLCIEMEKMPLQYKHFFVETWVENALRYFTQRNFCIEDKDTSEILGYGRSVWALIDLETRQPQDIMAINDGEIDSWVEAGKECPIAKPGRVKIDDSVAAVKSIDTHYSDVDINGHINSVKYIEHILDLYSLDFYKKYNLKRLDIAYVAESHFGDKLNFYKEELSEKEHVVRIKRQSPGEDKEVEVVRCSLVFVDNNCSCV